MANGARSAEVSTVELMVELVVVLSEKLLAQFSRLSIG
jgi:hypothetical protein